MDEQYLTEDEFINLKAVIEGRAPRIKRNMNPPKIETKQLIEGSAAIPTEDFMQHWKKIVERRKQLLNMGVPNVEECDRIIASEEKNKALLSKDTW